MASADALRLLLAEAAAAGASAVVAQTTRDNTAALRLLRARGASLQAPDAEGHVHAALPVASAP